MVLQTYFFQMLCRPLLCPVGEIRFGCHCSQPIKNLSGMPVYLKLMVIPKSDNILLATGPKIRKFQTALKKVLQKTVNNITAEIAAIFRQEKTVSPYYFCIAAVRTDIGYDTKETLKTFLPFLDTPRFLAFSSVRTTFYMHFLTRVFVWSDYNSQRGIFETRAEDLDDVEHNLTFVYSNEYFMELDTRHIQFFSPLMYCKQLQLDKHEFVQEHEGKITITTTTKMKHIWNFYRILPSQVRICVDQYLDQSGVSVTTLEFISRAMIALCFVSTLLF